MLCGWRSAHSAKAKPKQTRCAYIMRMTAELKAQFLYVFGSCVACSSFQLSVTFINLSIAFSVFETLRLEFHGSR